VSKQVDFCGPQKLSLLKACLLPIIFIKSARRLNNQVFQANLGITIHADDDSDETLGHLVFLAQLKTNHPLRKYLIRLLTSKIPASPSARRGMFVSFTHKFNKKLA
jgi:hypothetical protein